MFDESAFRALVAGFRAGGYTFRNFFDFEAQQCVILRHDIDFSVDLAHAMAKTEADLGVQATYFFMVTSNAYNLFSSHNQRLVREVVNMGHIASLHFDPTVYSDVDKGFRQECEAIAPLTGSVEIASLHRPGDYLLDNNRALPDSRHTYEDRYFREIKYVSDSGGAFSYGHPLETAAFESRDTIHLLLHPVWWMTAPGCPSTKVREWQRQHFEFLNREAALNCNTFDGRGVLASDFGSAA